MHMQCSAGQCSGVSQQTSCSQGLSCLAPLDACRRLVLDRTLMEAVCGGVGEVAQICVLYPLETIKVCVKQHVLGRQCCVLVEPAQHTP